MADRQVRAAELRPRLAKTVCNASTRQHPIQSGRFGNAATQRLSGMPTSASGNVLSRVYMQRINLNNFPLPSTSVLGQTWKSGDAIATSALPPTTDIPASGCDVRKVPQGDIIGAQAPSLLLSGKRTRVSAIDKGRHRVDQATPDELQLIRSRYCREYRPERSTHG